MMTRGTKFFAEVCIEAANKSVDEHGFIAVRRLVEQFDAQLDARPLLCEGLIAAPKVADAKWLVLIDSDESGFDPACYASESSVRPLPHRVRFTVAHELAHMLRFRATEFGMELLESDRKQKTKKKLIGDLEREADSLAPLLLIAESAFETECASGEGRLTLDKITQCRKRWAVSRQVLLSRFRLLLTNDKKNLRFRSFLRNIGIGLGEWNSKDTASILEWPQPFLNFDDGIVPEFLLGHKSQRAARLEAAFSSHDFCLSGGTSLSCNATIAAGTQANPRADDMAVRIEVENVVRSNSSKFLFLIEKVGTVT